MAYTKTVWSDEVPAASPIKYKVTDDVGGVVANSAKIELVTSVTAGTPINASNLNKIEIGLEAAAAIADSALLIATAAMAAAYPVGSIYITTVSTNPATVLGFGTWSAFSAGRVLVGFDASQSEFDAVEETGGAKTHTLTATEIPAHVHTYDRTTGPQNVAPGADVAAWNVPTTANTSSIGGGGAHNNLQPYMVVYMWKRTL